MIRTMNERMAAKAITAIHLRARRLIAQWQQASDGGCIAVREIGAAVHGTGVIRRVALLAQPGCSRLEERAIVRTMGRVAVGAVFRYRRVLPEERAAPVRVTGVAGFVHAVLEHQMRANRSVRVMAIRTTHFSRYHRVGRLPVKLRVLRRMAGKADFGLTDLVEHTIAMGVDLVA